MASDRRLSPHEWVIVAYCAFVMALIVLARVRIPGWGLYLGAHAAVAGSAIGLALWKPRAKFFAVLRDFDAAIYIPVLFLMTCDLVHLVHPVDYDDQLQWIDGRIGGLALLRWMAKIETKFLTTASKLLWVVYYFLTFIPGIPLYLRHRAAFHEAKLLVVLAFLISYVGYFALPAQGPGYFQEKLGIRQPKFEESKLTTELKTTIHKLEKEARDTFPSGHVMIAAMTILLLLKNRLWRAAIVGVPISLGVIWSTVYLRYHYLIDGLVGIALAGLIAWLAPKWQRSSS